MNLLEAKLDSEQTREILDWIEATLPGSNSIAIAGYDKHFKEEFSLEVNGFEDFIEFSNKHDNNIFECDECGWYCWEDDLVDDNTCSDCSEEDKWK